MEPVHSSNVLPLVSGPKSHTMMTPITNTAAKIDQIAKYRCIPINTPTIMGASADVNRLAAPAYALPMTRSLVG